MLHAEYVQASLSKIIDLDHQHPPGCDEICRRRTSRQTITVCHDGPKLGRFPTGECSASLSGAHVLRRLAAVNALLECLHFANALWSVVGHDPPFGRVPATSVLHPGSVIRSWQTTAEGEFEAKLTGAVAQAVLGAWRVPFTVIVLNRSPHRLQSPPQWPRSQVANREARAIWAAARQPKSRETFDFEGQVFSRLK